MLFLKNKEKVKVWMFRDKRRANEKQKSLYDKRQKFKFRIFENVENGKHLKNTRTKKTC